jgi:hypothetical protein
MSTQSILELNKDSYFNKVEDKLLCLSDSYFYKRKFLLGEGVNRDELSFNMTFHRILNSKECTINNYIKNKIEGKLQERKVKKRKSFQKNLHKYSELMDCTEQEALNIVCKDVWTNIEW